MKRSFAILIFFAVCFIATGQQRLPFKLSQSITKDAYQPGTIVVKLKSPDSPNTLSSNRNTSNKSLGIDAINGELKAINTRNIRKIFVDNNRSSLRIGGSKNDLSNIYIVNISPDLGIEEAINVLLQNDRVEYAEPYYNHKLLHVPNDPNANTTTGSQYQLKIIKAYEAWDVQRGDSTMVVAIIDTGVLPTHTDLLQNLKHNYDDPTNNIDDDNDGYVDNFSGWDFSMHDNDPTADQNGHGTEVTGCSSSRANNGIGGAGTGYNSKFLPLKVFNSMGNFGGGFEAIKYAADHGCKIINLSWGNDGGYSQFEQDVINYAVLERDVVVVAAAGNSNTDTKFYPASYDNVLSVGSTDKLDQKAGTSTFNNWIDVAAPGEAVGTTSNSGNINYTLSSGTSLASPVVAGAAGLIRLRFPKYNALQVMEQLRVTSDKIFNKTQNSAYIEKMGFGRLNMFRAVTDTTSPSIRTTSFSYTNGTGNYAFYGDTIKLNCDFKNYLTASNNLKVTLSSNSPYVTIIKGEYALGKIRKLEVKNNLLNPFEFYLREDTPPSQKILFRIGYEDGNYSDYQYIEIYTSPDYINTKYNSISLTTISDGRIGFKNASKTQGIGLTIDNQQLLENAGIMFATSATKVSNNAVSNISAGTFDNDFTTLKNVKYFRGSQADLETRSTFVDSISNPNKIGLVVTQKSYGWKSAAKDNFVILEYSVTNTSKADIPSLYTGLFADWNIGTRTENKADWDAVNNFGYVYSTTSGKMVAIGLLTSGSSIYYALDNFNDNGNGILLTDDFSKVDKWNSLINGIAHTKAGVDQGSDVSHVVGVKIDNIGKKKSVKVAFAIAVGNSLEELQASIQRAKSEFANYQSNPPVSLNVKFCNNSPATIARSNNKPFRLYEDLSLTSLLFSGDKFITGPLSTNKAYYMTNEDDGFEGEATKVEVLRNDAIANFSMDKDTVDIIKGNLAKFFDLTPDAVKWSWDFDNGYKSTNKNPIKTFVKQGKYKITLMVENSTGCKDTLVKELVVISSSPKPIVSPIYICKGEDAEVLPINGTNFRFYDSFPLTTPIFEGRSYYINKLDNSKKLWITNTDSLKEGEPLSYTINVWDNFADFSFSADTLDLDKSSSVIVKDLANNSMQWTWTNGSTITHDEGKTTFSFHKTGAYSITMAVVNSTGCADTVTKNLVVARRSPRPENKSIEICKNSSVSISYSKNGNYRFYKGFPGFPIFEGKEFLTGLISEDTKYYVTNIDSLIESAPAEIIIRVIPIESDFSISKDTLKLDSGNSVQLSTSSETIKKWKWDFGNGKKDTTDNPTAFYNIAGIYTISLITANSLNCIDTTFKSLVVLPSNVEDDLNKFISIYPNPANKYVELHSAIPGEKDLAIEILNSQGKNIMRFENQKFYRGKVMIDVRAFNSGIYFVRIISKEASVIRRIIIKNDE